jgi:S-adenosylmethionine uptake transporter
LFGLFLFGDEIPLVGWAGMFLIVLSGIAATALRDRSLNKVPVEEH